jgi:myosin-5
VPLCVLCLPHTVFCLYRCSADLVELVQTSDSVLVKSIGDETASEMEGKRGGQTVSSRFTGQLKELVAMLDATGLHFVRCIKPNAALAPGQLTTELVLQQLRCCGVLEVARVSRAGYPTRYRWAGRREGRAGSCRGGTSVLEFDG